MGLPLNAVKVLELAGLAPGPFTGLLCADWGASVLRVDRPVPGAHTDNVLPTTRDVLSHGKTSITVDLKNEAGLKLIKNLLPHVDVLIDPFRPGVLERIGLPPDELLRVNPRLIIARLTGFRRDGKYANMAGHDMNYIAVSGVLSMIGGKGQRPVPPLNLMGDFAGGGLVCFLGIVLALLARVSSGKGQIVESNMVDGSAFIAISPRLNMKTPLWDRPRGTNLLDGGCPYYQVYETRDGQFMAVAAIEPQFFDLLLKGLSLTTSDLPGPQDDRHKTWPYLFELFTNLFKSKSRREWEDIFDGTDACVTPVLTQQELEQSGYEQRPIVHLKSTPAYGYSSSRGGWTPSTLYPGQGGETTLKEWLGWKRNRNYSVVDGGLVKVEGSKL
ncbi:alpha-methylacyl-CoA racemase [Talaromyces proteolyticus]|uniref:Alpha-methylacyl-CoA racemase n=1 Tax=Talaromyces proteolyticus TaxID=1131652 RepID=A0AAD4Q0C8_9EURO|nr:alpha-methylacyl-CoA racemase [Talaromyces proteolyticus]KAH8697517.1 alpha-methylacyl-CoA racemase [Talaromyces proteolyticus]